MGLTIKWWTFNYLIMFILLPVPKKRHWNIGASCYEKLLYQLYYKVAWNFIGKIVIMVAAVSMKIIEESL